MQNLGERRVGGSEPAEASSNLTLPKGLFCTSSFDTTLSFCWSSRSQALMQARWFSSCKAKAVLCTRSSLQPSLTTLLPQGTGSLGDSRPGTGNDGCPISWAMCPPQSPLCAQALGNKHQRTLFLQGLDKTREAQRSLHTFQTQLPQLWGMARGGDTNLAAELLCSIRDILMSPVLCVERRAQAQGLQPQTGGTRSPSTPPYHVLQQLLAASALCGALRSQPDGCSVSLCCLRERRGNRNMAQSLHYRHQTPK